MSLEIAENYNQLGIEFFNKQSFIKAKNSFNKAIKICPHIAEYYNNLGVTLVNLEKFSLAETYFKKALAIKPSYSEALNNLGNILLKQDKMLESINYYLEAIKFNNNNFEAHNNLGTAYFKEKDYKSALKHFQISYNLNPNYPILLTNLAKTNKVFGDINVAKQYAMQALATNTNLAETYNILGEIAVQESEITAAKDYFVKSIAIDDNMSAICNLAKVYLFKESNYQEALIWFYKLPDQELGKWFGLHSCAVNLGDWKLIAKASHIIEKNLNDAAVDIFMGSTIVDNPALLYQIACKFAKLHEDLSSPFIHPQKAKNVLTIGFMSPDFDEHPVGLLVNGIFEKFNRDKYRIIGIATKAHNFSYQYRKNKLEFDEFIALDSNITYQEKAQILYNKDIDILIDLSGATEHASLPILTFQPAKIQCQMIGFAGTLGSKYVQYYIADSTLIPDSLAPYFAESIVQLPYGQIGLTPYQDQVAKPREHYGLPANKTVFCNFHSPYRITKEALTTWMLILNKVPDSVLWLRNNGSVLQKQYLEVAQEYNIARERIIFGPATNLTEEWHIKNADLWLDTFVLTGGTSTSIALWAGLPVLNKVGNGAHTRTAASYCQAHNTPETICYSMEEYIDKAVYLGNNQSALQQLKNKTLYNRDASYLFQQDLYVRSLESTFDKLWQLYLNKEQPKIVKIMDNNNGCS